MNILEALMAAQGGGAVKQLGQQFGLCLLYTSDAADE